jgi:hypothetical protein
MPAASAPQPAGPEWLPPAPWEPIPDPPQRLPGFLRRNWVSLIACAVAVVSLAVAVAALADSGGSTQAAGAATSSPISAAPSTPAAPATHSAIGRRATRATIESESGSTWTVQTATGQMVTVTITPQTQFGTAKTPATESDFPVGSNVVITGTVDSGVATANRVAAQKAPTAVSSSSTPS